MRLVLLPKRNDAGRLCLNVLPASMEWGYLASIKWFRQFENALRVGIPALRRMGIVMEIAAHPHEFDSRISVVSFSGLRSHPLAYPHRIFIKTTPCKVSMRVPADSNK